MKAQTASRIIWAAHGSPAVPLAAAIAGTCWVCAGAMDRGVAVKKWMGANFVGQNRVRFPMGTHVCEACVFVMAGQPPNTLRMQSHLWDERTGYQRPIKSREGLRVIARFLREPHSGRWLAAIAESGKKHVIPWTPINVGGTGAVLFEESIVVLPRSIEGWGLLKDVAELRTLGASSEEIAAGEYSPHTWLRCPDALRGFEAHHADKRGGAWFRLCVFLGLADEARRAARIAAEKEAIAAKKAAHKAASKKPAKPGKEGARASIRRAKGASADADGGSDPQLARRVPRGRRKPAQALGSDRGEAPCELASDDVAGGVDLGDVRQPESAGVAQRGGERGE